MFPWITALLAGSLLLGVEAVRAGGTVDVTFKDVSRYMDAGSAPHEREATLAQLAKHLKQLGERHLPDGHSLKIEVLEVDLAGTLRPSRRTGAEVRVVRGRADWPKFELRYVLSARGSELRSGTDAIADLDYARRLRTPEVDAPLGYEMRLLEEWFVARIVEGRPLH